MTYIEAIISCYIRPQRLNDKIEWYQNECRIYLDEYLDNSKITSGDNLIESFGKCVDICKDISENMKKWSKAVNILNRQREDK